MTEDNEKNHNDSQENVKDFKEEIQKVESALLNQHQELVEKEKQIFAGLNEKYGDGNYDPNTNEFTPIEKEETKSKEVKK